LLKYEYMASDDIKKILETFKEHTQEIKRHFDVVAESIDDGIKILSEQVVANTEKLEERDQRFDGIENKLEVMGGDAAITKDDIAFIKNELTQKVSREEFVVLEKRLSLL